MTTALLLAYIGFLIGLAYYVGRKSAGRGVFVIIVGVAAMQLYINGPASFLEGGCETYGNIARDC